MWCGEATCTTVHLVIVHLSSVQRETARRVNTNDLGNHDRKKRQCSPMFMIAIKGLHPIEPISWLQKVSVYEDYCRPSVNFLSLLCLFTKHTHEKDQSPGIQNLNFLQRLTPKTLHPPPPPRPSQQQPNPFSPHRRTRPCHTPPAHCGSGQSPATATALLQFH